MKALEYPNRVAVPVDKEHGKMLEQLARDTHRARPSVFLAALRLFFDQNYRNSQSEKQKRGAQ